MGHLFGAALQKVKICDGPKIIQCCSFFHCKKLEEITIPGSVKLLEEEAFAESGLSEVKICDGVEEIEDAAFKGCKKLGKAVIPGSVKKIGKCVFTGSGLEKVIICDGVEEIGSCAFSGCEKLREIVIPPSMKRIGKFAFKGSGVEKVRISKYTHIEEGTLGENVEICYYPEKNKRKMKLAEVIKGMNMKNLKLAKLSEARRVLEENDKDKNH